MHVLRIVLSVIFVSIAISSGVVNWSHGMGLLPIFFGDMAKMAWPGQFNLDSVCLLALSGWCVSWRQRSNVRGILLGVVAFFGGALFPSAYLLVQSFRAGGDLPSLTLGGNRAHP